MKSNLPEIELRLCETKSALLAIKNAKSGDELRYSWESFLFSFSRTLGRIIAAAMLSPNSKPWAYKLKNASITDDEGLVYLREARNAAEHGLTPFATFHEPLVDVGGILSTSGNGTYHFSNNTVNGVDTGTFSVQTEKGKVTGVSGKPKTRITEVPALVTLTPIYSREKRMTFPVPKMCYGEIIPDNSPSYLAHVGLENLEDMLAEFKKLAKADKLSKGD